MKYIFCILLATMTGCATFTETLMEAKEKKRELIDEAIARIEDVGEVSEALKSALYDLQNAQTLSEQYEAAKRLLAELEKLND